MHPHHHSLTSVRIWGGRVEDYAPIHDWFDATKESFADARHRALRHHSQGIFEAERVFGRTITNSDGRIVPVRYIGEQHVKEDCAGRIPTVADWFRNIRMEPWMNRGYQVEGPGSTGSSGTPRAPRKRAAVAPPATPARAARRRRAGEETQPAGGRR